MKARKISQCKKMNIQQTKKGEYLKRIIKMIIQAGTNLWYKIKIIKTLSKEIKVLR